MPYPAKDPKSGWSPFDAPMLPISVAESDRTARPETGRFQTLVAGKTGQPAIVGPGPLGGGTVGAGVGTGVGARVGVGAGVGAGGAVGSGGSVTTGGAVGSKVGSLPGPGMSEASGLEPGPVAPGPAEPAGPPEPPGSPDPKPDGEAAEPEAEGEPPPDSDDPGPWLNNSAMSPGELLPSPGPTPGNGPLPAKVSARIVSTVPEAANRWRAAKVGKPGMPPLCPASQPDAPGRRSDPTRLGGPIGRAPAPPTRRHGPRPVPQVPGGAGRSADPAHTRATGWG